MGGRILAALCGALALAGCATASAPLAPQLDETEARFVRDYDALVAHARERLPDVPGLSIAVARSDGPLYVAGVGRADIEAGVAASADTRFYIASSTKSYVALALALLDARGEIDLDWTLAELAPDVRFDAAIRAGEVTLRHMLSHTHGFDSDAITDRLAYSGEHDPQTLWRLLGRLPPNRDAPLGAFDYGNVGYNVATLLVERRLGRPWQQILEREVLRPLGLNQTLARGVAGARARRLLAAPYNSLLPGRPVRLYLLKYDDTMQSAGGMFSSANDMARWLQLHLAAAKGRPTPLPAAVVASTHRSIASFNDRFEMFERTGYGLGWYSGDYGGDTLYHSFGGYTGARAHVSFMPARDVGVAVLANDEGAGFILADVLAAYVYDWFQRGPEPAGEAARAMIERIAAEVPRRRERIAADRARRAERAWTLSLPPDAYVGQYCNDEVGTIVVRRRNGGLAMAMGRLRAEFEPFTEPETVRMEPIPGTGRVLRFIVENGRVNEIEAFDARFERCLTVRSG